MSFSACGVVRGQDFSKVHYLPKPKIIRDKAGVEWAGYTLAQLKELMKLDANHYKLTLDLDALKRVDALKDQQLELFRQAQALSEKKYSILEARFNEQAKTIQDLIADRNRWKYKKRWTLFKGGVFSVGTLVIVAAIAIGASKD